MYVRMEEINQKSKILIVDDEKSNLMLLNRILSAEYTIFTAKSGEEALTRVRKDEPDLILMDVIMPGMSGFDALMKLKEDDETSRIPVIIITGLNSEGDEEKGFALGAVDYMVKPFNHAIVRARVKIHMQIVQQIRTIERLGLVDSLTNMPNRRSFDSHFAVEWKRAAREKKPISFLMLDVDHFKNYNDTYGHPQGDVLLKAVAKIFMQAARRPTDLAARIGGEEFGVLLPETTLESALIIAERIRSQVEAERIPLLSDGQQITSVTISIGVASCIPQAGDSSEAFVARADKFLYVAKNSGRNQIYFEK
jgi:diguanylate cyclase (GGDEF)-like protein